MSARGETITVDLRAVQSTPQLMDVLGEALQLGGPDGNVDPADGKGWGKNWDALYDSLRCLDSGGIWGTNRKPQFPLRMALKNSATLRSADREGYSLLLEVLEDTREWYARHGLEFAFELAP